MFWRFGGYANISTIDTVLDKPDATLEEVLDESDLIQELKQHNTKLIEYLRDEHVLERLVDVVIAPAAPVPDDDDEDEDEEEEPAPKKKTLSPIRSLSIGRSKEKKSRKQEEREEREKQEKTRQRYAYVASEILSSETWSIIESLMENRQLLTKFWEFLRREPTLDPVTAGYFTKVNETLLDKKTEDTLTFIKSLDGIIPAMLQHIDCPMIMDLLLKIISLEKAEGGQGIVDWLQTQDLVPTLLAYLGPDHPTFTQTSAGDFIKAIITISANASQNEQSCIGPNSLTRQLVSESCVKPLVADMLKGGNPLTVGVGIIIEVIRKNNSDYDPEVSAGQELPPSSSDPIYLGTLLRIFAQHVSDFVELVLSPNHTVSAGESTVSVKRKELQVAFGSSIEPLGFDRFKTCELMAELLHCSNMGLLNERGSEAYVHQRDQERERLRAEGKLQRSHEPQSAATEFSEDGSHLRDDSLQGIAIKASDKEKRPGPIDSAEDDGFEDVGASGDLADEMRDEFDDKNDFEMESGITESASPIKPLKSRLSLEDEFFDEPLHSPGKSSKQEQLSSSSTDQEAETIPTPQSPASSLASNVDKMELTGKDNESQDLDQALKSPTDELIGEIDAQLSPRKEGFEETTSSSEQDQNLNVQSNTPDGGSPGGMSPHPEDTPAPLFASGTEEVVADTPEAAVEATQDQKSAQPTKEAPEQAPESVAQDVNADFAPHIESDLDGQPIVGDFLKMQFVEHGVVPTILDFFFRFPWNNFLHNVVYDVVQQVFNGSMDRGFNRNLAIDLFLKGRITDRIIEGQLRSDEAQARNNMRLGYMGHLTLIAEEVVKFADRHPAEVLSEPVVEIITQRLWSDFVENTLAETRERDNAILGGVRPDAAGGPRQAVLNAVNMGHGFGNSGSSVLANAGLNGSTGNTSGGLDSMDLSNTAGGNFLNSGSLLSGFGSSSDEEDEEMEEIGEQEGTVEGNSDQTSNPPTGLSALSIFYSNNNTSSNESNETSSSQSADATPSSTSSSSPSQSTSQNNTPSIPPPLNIPPSRARRQLAARLALKEQEKQNAPNNSPTTSSLSEKTGSPGLNPGSVAGAHSPAHTPDTPAFRTGSAPHQRGTRKSRLAGTPEAIQDEWSAGTNGDIEGTELGAEAIMAEANDDDDGEEEEDPWMQLDSTGTNGASSSSQSGNHTAARLEDEEDEEGDGVWMSSSVQPLARKTPALWPAFKPTTSSSSSARHMRNRSLDLGDDEDDATAAEYAGGGIEDVDAETDEMKDGKDVMIKLEASPEQQQGSGKRVGRGIWGRWGIGGGAGEEGEEGNSSDEEMVGGK